jgi:hypothetical protein
MKRKTKAERNAATVMREFKTGTLHSGSAKEPRVTNRRQAIAIALSEGRKAGKKRKKR